MSQTKKTSKLWIIASVVIGCLVVIALKAPSGVPDCGSADARLTLMDAFDQSPGARAASLVAEHAHSAEEVESSEDGSARACRAILTLNSKDEMKVTYTMKLMEDGRFELNYAAGW
ncbi:MAG: hypothetical protein CMB99_00680 [Flavobacteriaceae bacterium]|nr:hypothetical protein [Flavobacteriaceae bacterium]|tara:strand:- start:1078 stop:1425 length:348 start_codon:yes stop_codon:yes gene_type:complete